MFFITTCRKKEPNLKTFFFQDHVWMFLCYFHSNRLCLFSLNYAWLSFTRTLVTRTKACEENIGSHIKLLDNLILNCCAAFFSCVLFGSEKLHDCT